MNLPNLYIANKNYSSWSMRPWLALKVKDIAFVEQFRPFDDAQANHHFQEFSPTARVPALTHDGETYWESLAILEYVADTYEDKALWPSDRQARAQARCVSAEMLAGFLPLRTACPMNMNRTPGALELDDDVRKDIERIENIWADCLDRSGGPFLFGDFTIADAMYAPVVSRFDTYLLGKNKSSKQYGETLKALPAWQGWAADAAKETKLIHKVEI